MIKSQTHRPRPPRPSSTHTIASLHDCTIRLPLSCPDDELLLPPRWPRDCRRSCRLTDCAQTSTRPSLSITTVTPIETSFVAKLQNIDPLSTLALRHGPPAQILSTKTTWSPCSFVVSILHSSLPKARIGGKRHRLHTTSRKIHWDRHWPAEEPSTFEGEHIALNIHTTYTQSNPRSPASPIWGTISKATLAVGIAELE